MKKKIFSIAIVCLTLLVSCSVSFKMSGTSIDYSLVKSISVADFPNMAPMVYPALAPVFNEALKDIYSRQTRLSLLSQGGDLNVEGEITNYDLTPLSIQTDAFASETRMTISVRVRFTNNTNHEEDFEETFSANDKFSSDRLLSDVQDELIQSIVAQITENIFNRTVANW
jgi:hypothetical protein